MPQTTKSILQPKRLGFIFLVPMLVISSSLVGANLVAKPIQLAEGELTLEAPDDWPVVKPANRLIETELSVTAKDSDEQAAEIPAARLTMMQAGGSVDANISRWIGQFQGNEGGADRSQTKTEKIEVEGMPVTIVELGGTYMQSMRGPFGPKTPRQDYRLVGAIVETGSIGNYFFKLIGPDDVVAPSAGEFRAMIKTLKKQATTIATEGE